MMHRHKNFSMKWQVKKMTVKEELALINEYSRKELGEDDVYIFTLTLCDNEVDRDHERFPLKTLEELAGPLYERLETWSAICVDALKAER